MAKTFTVDLDRYDHSILEIVQKNNQLTHAQVGAQVNLSTSSVRRRLQTLRKSGVIRADVALLDRNRLGLSFLVQVWTKGGDRSLDADFRKEMVADAHVSQCYSVSGDFDYTLVAHAETPEAYENWSESRLMDHPLVDRYTSVLVWSQVKFETAIPMG